MTKTDTKGGEHPCITYILSRVGTGTGVGWFACRPAREAGFDANLAHVRAHPMDEFMHKHLLDQMREMDSGEISSLLQRGLQGDGPLLALAAETILLNTKFSELQSGLDGVALPELLSHTPLIYLRWSMDPERERNFYWLRAFSKNLHRLAPLPAPGAAEHPVPVSPEAVAAWRSGTVPLAEIASLHSQREPLHHRTAPRETAKRLSRRLEQMGILAGWETRTEATISPFAIERPWSLSIEVADGRNHWRLTGEPVSYGRGLNVHQGRISCIMEAVERYCAFAGCRDGRLEGYTQDHTLLRATHGELKASGRPALDPDTLGLEVPYRNEPLCWVAGERRGPAAGETVMVPAQLVFLFANFDEISLTSGLLSSGLGAGETQAQARLSALLEVIERDADKVVPFSPKRCFTLEADDEKTADIIEGCRRKGIHIQFLDITSELGVPAFRAFIRGPSGAILKGSAAHLDGQRAAVSALTEIPYPYPYWFGSMDPVPEAEPRSLEELPNYATGSPEGDLALLEELLFKNGYAPVYVDLTRESLGIPVVKALVPGLEMMTVIDRFSPLGMRQFGHYLSLFEGG